MKFWQIPKLCKGGAVILLGGGPSLPSLIDGIRFVNAYVIAINDAFRLYPDADMLFFGDTKWYWWNKGDVDGFNGLKVTCDRQRKASKVAKDGKIFPSVRKVAKGVELNIVRTCKGYGLRTESDRINFNSSSGAAAINLAYHLGAKEVVLVGYDMRLINGERNWRRHPNQGDGPQKGYEKFLGPFDKIAPDALEVGLNIINATPGSGLKHFPFMGLTRLCKLWTSIKLFAICWLSEQVLLDMVMESLSFA
jgi:uncharacterized Rossmann fold enzyme